MSDKSREQDNSHEQTRSRYSRRGFLGRVGVGAGAVAVGPAGAIAGAAGAAPHNHIPGQSPLNFGRMFSDRLPAFADPTPSVKAALREVGKAGASWTRRTPSPCRTRRCS